MLLTKGQGANIEPLLPNYPTSTKGGRPRLNKRKIFESVLYVCKNRIPWKQVPEVYGSGSALNNYFREWAESGVFHRIKENHFFLVHSLDWEKVDFLNKSHGLHCEQIVSVLHSNNNTQDK